MARYQAKIRTEVPAERAFAYLSDFANTREWDPGVVDARRLTSGRVGTASKFELKARFLGRTVPLTYTIVEYEAPRSLTLVGENSTVFSRDRIEFEPDDGGSWITYDAELTLKGPLRLADPLLALAFKRVGDRALDGLRARMKELSAAQTAGTR